MPKRARGEEDAWGAKGAPGAEPEPLFKLHCGPKQQYEKTCDSHNSVIEQESSDNNNDVKLQKRKSLKQMLIGSNMQLYTDVEIMPLSSISISCSICKIQMLEKEASCSYCEVPQCYSCAIICSVCSLPTCPKCSINSFAGHDRVFCFSCCR